MNKNEKSIFVGNNVNKNGDINNGGTTNKRRISSVLKLCTSVSNPAHCSSVHINSTHQMSEHKHEIPFHSHLNVDYSDDHTTPSTEITLRTPQALTMGIGNGNFKSNEIEMFGGDLLANNTWLTCCNIYDETIVSFNALYPELMKIWNDKTECERIPNKNDILPIFIRLGGIVVNNVYVMRKKKFLKFWKWFKNCLIMINEMKYLWDSFELNLFYQRKESEELLSKSVPGIA